MCFRSGLCSCCRWIDQIRRDNDNTPPADLWRLPSDVVTVERRYGPRWLRDGDNDDFAPDAAGGSIQRFSDPSLDMRGIFLREREGREEMKR